MPYIYENANWPHFQWKIEALAPQLLAIRHRQGQLLGRMESLGFPLQKQALFSSLTQDVLQTSAIEGEILNLQQVRSSLARRLHIDIGALVAADRHVDGVVEMLLNATQHFADPLTAERLFSWHAKLFPDAHSGFSKITVGAWRTDHTGPMQVVSGPIGREKVYYQAPPASALSHEMSQFLNWFDEPGMIDQVLKAAIAHLWFVTIHPFDDGNGRIARAIADFALARSENSPQRFYSMSAQIHTERDDYYRALEITQRGDLDITPWLLWFLACLGRAFDASETMLASVLKKARFWERYAAEPLNPRQRLVINRLLEDFTGKLTSSKWGKLAKCSHDTALRDIAGLVSRHILHKDPAGGRSTSYSLAAI